MYRILGADGREYGPVSADQLRRWVAEGRANGQTGARAEGAAVWTPLAQLPEFYSLFTAARPAPPLYFQTRKTNSFAVTGLVMGLLSLTCGLCCYGIPFNVMGVIFSIIGLSQIHNNPGLYNGKGLAITGLVLSLLGIAIMLGLISLVALDSIFNNQSMHHFRRF